jgi:hypothetical protein
MRPATSGARNRCKRLAAARLIPRAFLFGILLLSVLPARSETAVSKHERLHVLGNSFFPSNTGWEGAKFYNPVVVSWLAKDWGSTVVRAAMGVEESHGYFFKMLMNMA